MVGPRIEFDAALELCGDKHRRIVIAVLAEQRSVTVDDLTEAIVEHNHHRPLTEVSDRTTTRIDIALHHNHVPKLESAGLVEYDPERRLVEPTAKFDQVKPHLAAILDADPEITPQIGK